MRGGPVGERQRKAHKKSRGGCVNCKKNHYKCDEQQPSCLRCNKRKIECSFQHSESPVSDISDNTRVFVAISHNITSHDIDPNQLLPMVELELYHNSLMSTRFTITPERSEESEDDHQLCFNFPYLMHTQLALSALHLYSKQPHRTELVSQAASHQHAALALVKPHIVDLTEEHSNAVLKFSAVTSIFALAEPAYDLQGLGVGRDAIDELVNSFHLSRGIKSILTQRWDVFQEVGSIAKLISLKEYANMESTLDERYPALVTIKALIPQHCDSQQAAACLHAAEKVFKYMAILEEYPNENPGPMYVQMWPIDIDMLVIDMVTARKPSALVILAYYAALMKLRSDTWWLCRWPLAILNQIEKLLDLQWTMLLEWPRSKILSPDSGFEHISS